MIQESKITKVSEEPWGEWIKTVWSDGRVLLHRHISKPTLNPFEENRQAARQSESRV